MPQINPNNETTRDGQSGKNFGRHPHHHEQIPMKPLAAFAMYPKGVRFETQEEEETVELFSRQHPIVNVGWLFITGVLVLTPSLLIPMLFRIVPISIPAKYYFVSTVFWYVATFGYALANFIHWFFNIYIVTNERIVDIDFKYLLYKHFGVAELNKIQDISYSSGGVMAAFFNYGNVLVQTASEIPTIVFEKVPHPDKIVETIRSLTEQYSNENV